MPIYEYLCGTCGCRFERKQHFDEEAIALCPHCRGKSRRVIHSIPVIYKGSGFYTTDYRKETSSSGETASKAATKLETKPVADSGTKPETKTETKSETESSSKKESPSNKN